MVSHDVLCVRGREEADRRARGVIVTHPNRDKPVVQATRAMVVVLLLVTAALMLIITVGGWKPARGRDPDPDRLHRRLPDCWPSTRAAGTAACCRSARRSPCCSTIFALVAGPGWFNRNKAGFAQPTLNAGLLGVLTLLIVPVQILLVVVRDARLQTGLERRARAPRSGGGRGRDRATIPTPRARPDGPARPGRARISSPSCDPCAAVAER